MLHSRLIATSLGSLALALALTGCSGGDDSNVEPDAVFTGADAKRLAQIAPVTPGWPDWPERPEKKQPSKVSLEEVIARDPLFAEYHRRTSKLAGELGDSGNRWEDENKLANLSIGTFANSADAHVSFEAGNDLALGYGEMYGDVTKVEEVEGLGDEAWLLWASGNGSQVTYHWRRGNLVGEVHIHCFGTCPTTVDEATHTWAEAIDEEAQTGS
jgi:hypothetical protein